MFDDIESDAGIEGLPRKNRGQVTDITLFEFRVGFSGPSGINGGLNLGINVLYSGTVAGATEGAVANAIDAKCRELV